MHKSITKIIGAAVLLGFSFPSLSMTVFDPSNFIKNSITSAQSIAMEARQASQYATQLQQYIVQLKQQAALGTDLMSGPFNDVINTYKTVQQYQAELAGLQGAVGDVQSVMNNRMNLMAASGLSWDQYIKREKEGLKYRQDSNTILSAYERQVMDNAAKRYAKVQELQPTISATQGSHAAMMTMNTQMNMLTASMQDFITLSAAQGNKNRIDQNEEVARQRRAVDEAEAAKRAADKNNAESWSLIDRMSGKK